MTARETTAAPIPAPAGPGRAGSGDSRAPAPHGASAPEAPGPGQTPSPAGLGGQLALIAFDIGAPIALYYIILHGAGVPNLTALAISAAPPALAAVGKLAIQRRADTVALVVLATIIVSVCLSADTHAPGSCSPGTG